MPTPMRFHTEHADGLVLVTGATGLLGSMALKEWARQSKPPSIAVLVRDPLRWRRLAAEMGLPAGTTVVLQGDVTERGLGLTRETRTWLAGRTTAVVHLAADTTFSRPLDQARRVNRDGTRHLLEITAQCPHVTRFALVSTAFVAGRRTGRVYENAADPTSGWVNAYEQSKAEAEALVRESRRDFVILRSSTVACDDTRGGVTQRNAVHRALRLFHDGLAAMIPGVAATELDAVPADYVVNGVTQIALRQGVDGQTVHLCAGAGSMPIDELLDDSYARWARDVSWRKRGIARPTLADLETWELFARTVEETGHPRLRRVTQALSHFLPQLGLPKQFDTSRADALLGAPAPPVREYWGRMIDHLQATAWQGVAGLEAAA